MEQADIHTILQSLAAANGAPESLDARGAEPCVKYDFANPEHLPSEFLYALEKINTTIGRVFSSLLSEYSLSPVHVESYGVTPMPFRQYRQGLPDLPAIATFTMNPLEGVGLFDIDAPLVWYLIDHGLGGSSPVVTHQRELTQIERGLLEDLLQRLLREIGKAWEVLGTLRPNLQESGLDPSFIHTAHAEDRLVVCSFGITLSTLVGHCTYAIPVRSLDFQRLLDHARNAGESSAESQPVRMQENLPAIPMPVQACLHGMSLSFGEVAALRAGDIIQTDCRVDDPIEVRIGNRLCFYARPVTANNTLAIEILTEAKETNHA